MSEQQHAQTAEEKSKTKAKSKLATNAKIQEHDEEEMLPTQDIKIETFNIQLALEAHGSILAPRPTSAELSTEEGAFSSGDYDISEAELALLPQQSLSSDKPCPEAAPDVNPDATAVSGQKREREHGQVHSKNSAKRMKRMLEGSPHPPSVGRYRKQEEERRHQVLEYHQPPFSPQSVGPRGSLRQRHITEAIPVDSKVFSIKHHVRPSPLGFTGRRDKGVDEPAANPTAATDTSIPVESSMHSLLQCLLRKGYRYVPSDIEHDTLIHDATGTVIGVIAGIPKGLRSFKVDLTRAMDQFSEDLGNHSEDGGRRGDFKCSEYGVSYGGGQPVPMQFSKNRHLQTKGAWKRWRENAIVQAFLYHASEIYKTYNPTAYGDAEMVNQLLRKNDPTLWPDGPEPFWPWQAMTNNQRSATTIAYNHRDFNNGSETWCGVMPGANFDFRRGGQLVLHELQLIVELQPGQIILFPSALITHCNIPLAEGDRRFSITLYSPGGLYRYVAYGFRSWEAFEAQDPDGARAFERNTTKKRWDAHWDRMPTVPDLEDIWAYST